MLRWPPEILAADVQVLGSRTSRAYLLMGAGREDEANQAFAELMERAVGEIGESHPLFGVFEGKQGWCLVRSGREAEGLQVLERAAGRLDATLGPEHARTVLTRERIETTRAKLGKR